MGTQNTTRIRNRRRLQRMFKHLEDCLSLLQGMDQDGYFTHPLTGTRLKSVAQGLSIAQEVIQEVEGEM